MKSFREFLEEKETPKASEFEIGTKVKSFQYPGSRADSYLIGKVYNSDDNYHYIDVESAMDKGAEKYSFDKKVRASRFPHPHTGEYGVVKESVEELDEAKSDYTLYHSTYSAAVNHAHEHLKKKGFEISDDDWFHHVNNGPRKPSEGKTNSLHIPLQKDGKPAGKMAHVQVYNRGNDVGNQYELNMYHDTHKNKSTVREAEELDEALPPHLQKHVDNYNAKQAKFKVTDVTPKGYGPDDEEESEESKRLKLVISRARNGQRANESLDEASFYPANMDKLSPEERKAAHDMLMKRQSETNKKLVNMRSMSPEELHASFNKKPVTESSNTHDKRRAFNKGKTDFSLGKNRVPPNAVGYDAEAKKQWLRGWDSANLSNPITESDAHDRVKQVLDKVQAKNNPPTQEEKDAAYAKHIARMKKSAEEYVNNTPNSIYKKKED